MPDNFDLHYTDDTELEALMADPDWADRDLDEPLWADDVDPWLLDADWDA